jgi:8-oxo-dGTP diphosphatase
MSKSCPQLATLCYLRDNGKTLMLLRNKKQDDIHRGKWNGLGGKLEPRESPEQAARREILEESGLISGKLRLRGILSFPQFTDRDWYVFLYEGWEISGHISDCPEGQLEWIADSEVLSLQLWPGDRIFLPWFYAGRFFSAIFHYRYGKLQNYEVTFHDGL